MAISANCCLSRSAPPPPLISASLPTKTTQVSWPKKERSWRRQCALGAASIIIGLEMYSLTAIDQGMAMIAENPKAVVESNEQKGMRWSDKRSCPPWRVNALENIVPENLPRPSARRRWEAVGDTRIAPAVKAATVRTKSSGGCYTM